MNDMPIHQIIGTVLITAGVAFDLSGCIGLVRLPDVYNRIQASTKCVVLGTTLILLGAMVWLGTAVEWAKGLLCILFILVTSSTAAHALSRAAHRSGVKLWDKSVLDRYAEDRANGDVKEEGAA
ncbi:MAG: monovalent cation/H(+) antiporter subunit G [Lysobacterales bacterium]|jgi:multicomponent Na+:H+ antiporter subunit G